jgi:mannose-6-phosphate isomerase-like protein (cupin superfamily)
MKDTVITKKRGSMRLFIVLSVASLAAILISRRPSVLADGAEHASETVPASLKAGLILQQSEGERRVRRPRPDSRASMAAPSMIIKVDPQNGASPNFFVGYEEIAPGGAIPAHSHPEYDEVLFVHEGEGLATLGSQKRSVTAGATIYIPPKTRVSVRNTGRRSLKVFFVFPRPGMVSDYYRGMTVAEGEKAAPFSAEEFAAFRARHQDHIMFDEQ